MGVEGLCINCIGVVTSIGSATVNSFVVKTTLDFALGFIRDLLVRLNYYRISALGIIDYQH